jgi:hypothetical protein
MTDLLKVSRSREAEQTLQQALPYLIGWLQEDPAWPRAECRELYRLVLDMLIMDFNGSVDELSVYVDLVTTLCAMGMSSEEYRELIDSSFSLWEDCAAPRNIDWALDMLDVLAAHRCPLSEERQRFLARIHTDLLKWRDRVESSQWAVYNRLCREMGGAALIEQMIADGAQVEATPAATMLLNGKTIAIYTLMPSVARRVQAFLEEQHPGVIVNISHDKVGTPRLEHLAKTADIFIMATASAKHAATTFIQRHTKDTLLIRPVGKGSVSIIRALYEQLS